MPENIDPKYLKEESKKSSNETNYVPKRPIWDTYKEFFQLSGFIDINQKKINEIPDKAIETNKEYDRLLKNATEANQRLYDFQKKILGMHKDKDES
jgi:hypothetical protein